MKLANKVALVTGGGSGIGEAISHKFAQEGATVFLADLSDSSVKDVCDTIISHGGKAAYFLGDLSEEKDAEAFVEAVIDHFGQLDILASNAGVFVGMGEIDTWESKTFDYLVRMNTCPGFLMTKFALPHFRKLRGNIVYTGSIFGSPGRRSSHRMALAKDSCVH